MNRIVDYVREVRAELKKVLWPTRRETVAFTIIVVISVLVVSLLIWIMDSVLSQLLQLII